MSSQNYPPSFSLAADLEAGLATAALATGLDALKFRPEIKIAEPVHGELHSSGGDSEICDVA